MRYVVGYGNCQVQILLDLLRSMFPEEYIGRMIVNFKHLQDKSDLPWDIIRQADVLLYQPLVGHGIYDTSEVLSKLKPGAVTVSLPYVFFGGYFPDYYEEPLNEKTKGPGAPYGLWAYAHRYLTSTRGWE